MNKIISANNHGVTIATNTDGIILYLQSDDSPTLAFILDPVELMELHAFMKGVYCTNVYGLVWDVCHSLFVEKEYNTDTSIPQYYFSVNGMGIYRKWFKFDPDDIAMIRIVE